MTQFSALWHKHYWLVIAAILFLFLGSLQGLSARASARADNERVVTIYDGEFERTFITDATTVEEALKRADVLIHEADAVEPAIKSELIADNYHINVHRARPVLVEDGEKRVTLLSPYKSARQIVEKAGIPLVSEDIAELQRVDDVLQDGGVAQKISIDRATPMVLFLYGKKLDINTQGETVEEMLAEKNVVLGEKDIVTAPLSEKISAGMVVKVWREGVQTYTEEQEAPFPVRQVQDMDRPVGFREVQKAGKPGKRVVTYEVNYQNGQEIYRKEIQSVISVQPEEQVEIVGSKPTFSGSFAEALAKLRACEAGGNYQNKRNPLYRGAYQFSYSTWANYGGYYDPADAPPAVQDQAAFDLYKRRGWQPWPHCGSGLPDIYR